MKDYDYFQQLEILRFNIAQAADYADELAEMDPSLQLNAKGFSDLSLQFNNMINSDLSRLNATMTMNAVSKDLERLKGQYRFEIQDLQDQVKIQTDLMSNMDLLISTYGKSGIIYLSTTDALTKVDRESSKIYDSLVDLRNEVSAGISDLNNQNLHLLRKGKVVTKSLKYYGKTVESILGDYFGLESTRSNDVTNQIASLWKQIQNNKYKNETFEKEMQELTSILGADDIEIMAMKRDILRKVYEKNK